MIYIRQILYQIYFEKSCLKRNLVHMDYNCSPSLNSLTLVGTINPVFFTFKIHSMNVNIQSLHFDADSKLVSYVEKKITKLNQFHDRITKVDVFLKLDNVVHTIKDKVAEIRVHVPRHDFFVKHSSKSFEESFDLALDSVITQMKRKKDKMAA